MFKQYTIFRNRWFQLYREIFDTKFFFSLSLLQLNEFLWGLPQHSLVLLGTNPLDCPLLVVRGNFNILDLSYKKFQEKNLNNLNCFFSLNWDTHILHFVHFGKLGNYIHVCFFKNIMTVFLQHTSSSDILCYFMCSF